jgi:hypothetical protein
MLFRGIPPFVAGALVFALHVPGATPFGVLLLSVTLGIGVSFAFRWLAHGRVARGGLALQLAWLAALVVLGRVVLASAIRRVVIQGGCGSAAKP